MKRVFIMTDKINCNGTTFNYLTEGENNIIYLSQDRKLILAVPSWEDMTDKIYLTNFSSPLFPPTTLSDCLVNGRKAIIQPYYGDEYNYPHNPNEDYKKLRKIFGSFGDEYDDMDVPDIERKMKKSGISEAVACEIIRYINHLLDDCGLHSFYLDFQVVNVKIVDGSPIFIDAITG